MEKGVGVKAYIVYAERHIRAQIIRGTMILKPPIMMGITMKKIVQCMGCDDKHCRCGRYLEVAWLAPARLE